MMSKLGKRVDEEPARTNGPVRAIGQEELSQ